jgi:hypothetical protein
MVVTMKIPVFWDVTSCSLGEVETFRRNLFFHLQGRRVKIKVEASDSF